MKEYPLVIYKSLPRLVGAILIVFSVSAKAGELIEGLTSAHFCVTLEAANELAEADAKGAMRQRLLELQMLRQCFVTQPFTAAIFKVHKSYKSADGKKTEVIEVYDPSKPDLPHGFVLAYADPAGPEA